MPSGISPALMANRQTKLSASQRGNLPELTEEEIAELESRNGAIQFNRMLELIRQAIEPSVTFRLRPSTISELNALAIDGLEAAPGAYRTDRVEIVGSSHRPPPWSEVAAHVDDMCDYVNINWDQLSALHLSAYCMWRINWIHPYSNGNGRTSRIVSYLVLCAHLRSLLPGRPTIPEMIANSKAEYYTALEEADAGWMRSGTVDVSAMEKKLEQYLAAQLVSAIEQAAGQ